jgi:hypothetical protein
MPTEEFDHNGRHIVVTTEGEEGRVTINGTLIPYAHEPGTAIYVPVDQYSRFRSYPTLLEMARDVADHFFLPLGG